MGNVHSSPITDKAMLEKDGIFELSLEASQITTGLFGKFIRKLTVVDFQTNTATGDFTQVTQCNDGNVGSFAYTTVIGKYCEIAFDDFYLITQFRSYGRPDIAGDGRFKIQYWNGSAWVDNTVGIAQRLDSWSDWTDLTLAIITNKIRFVATTIDTQHDANYIAELEIKG